jgi:hypothetical protein
LINLVFSRWIELSLADAVVPFIARQVQRWNNENEADLRQPSEPLLPAKWISQLSEGEAALRKLQAELTDVEQFIAKSRL